MKKILLPLLLLMFIVGCTTTQQDEKYKVLFLNKDNKVINTIFVTKNEVFEYPDAPTIEGYEFIGWDKLLYQVTEDTTIKANYKKLSFTVKFYDINDNVISTQNIDYNETAIAPDLDAVEGYNFIGWDKEFEKVLSDLEIKPVYSKDTFVVKFYDINNNVISTQNIGYNETAIAPDLNVVEGYDFIGWDNEFNNVLSDLEIKPIYNRKTFIVKFVDNLGNLIDEQVVIYGENAVEPENTSIEGYTFTGWDKEFSNIVEDLVVTGVYEAIYYTVTFLDMYGDVIETKTVQSHKEAEAPVAPTVDYHTFSKWDKNLDKVTDDLTIQALYTFDNKTYDIKDVNYWLQIMSKKYNINKTLLEEDEIAFFNSKVVSDYSKTKVVDLAKISTTETYSNVYSLITKYSNINKYTIYNDSTGTAISSSEKTTILNNRNLDNIPTQINVKFGIITNFAWMRSYPTNYYSDKYAMDRFQETTLNVGEGVAIYHESLDGNWYFVQAQNYNGWVEKKNIALCSFDEMKEFINVNERLVVVSDYQIIENAHVRMGQAFPLIETNETTHKIKFPTRDNNGNLYLKEVTVANSENYSIGYLEYTYKNVYKQAFKLLGIDYSWGDKNTDGRDCSSTMNAIYTSFGFMMPRNTSNQKAIPSYGVTVSGINDSIMKTYKPGTMIFSSGHVMLYIGENASGSSYLLHNTTSGNGECILQALSSYGGSKIIGLLKMQ